MAGTIAQEEPSVGDSEAAPPELGPAKLAALLLSLIAGIALALAVMPWAFRNSPSDITRVDFLLEELARRRKTPPSSCSATVS